MAGNVGRFLEMASSSGLWTGLMDYELSVSERFVLVPVGGASLPKGGRSVRGTPVHLVSSRRGVEGEMMVCKVT